MKRSNTTGIIGWGFLVAALVFAGYDAVDAAPPRWIAFDTVERREIDFSVVEETDDHTLMEVTFPGMEVREMMVKGELFHDVVIPGCGTTTDPGLPKLPIFRRLLSIPDDCDYSIEIVAAEKLRLTGYRIMPYQVPPLRDGLHHREPFALDSSIYSRNSWIPGNPIPETEAGILRDYRVLPVDVYPVRFNPAEGTLRVLRSVLIKVTYFGESDTNVRTRYMPGESPVFRPVYEALIANYGSREREGDDRSRMLIISHDDFVDQVLPLVQWKNRKGIETDLVKFSDASPGGSSQEVKDYISQCYYGWEYPPDFVLLVGDVGLIPWWAHGWWIFKVRTDHTYACIDGDDDLADVIVGRISVKTKAEAEIVVQNTIRYEREPWMVQEGWFDAALSMASSDGIDPQNGDLFTSVFMDNGFDPVNNLQQRNGTLTKSNVTEALNHGRSWVWYIGHGSGTSWSSVSPSFTSSDVKALVNGRMTPVISSTACLNADLDRAGDCFGEVWMKHRADGGAAIFQGYTESVSFFTSDTLARGMLYAHFDYHVDSFGGMTDFGRYAVYTYFPGNYLDTVRMCICLGDPSIVPWSKPPDLLTVSHPDTITTGVTGIDVHVENMGTPLENALVTAMNDEVYASVRTDEGGDVTLDFGTAVTDPAGLAITVAKRNYEPYLADIPVMPLSGGLIACEITPLGSTLIPPEGGTLEFTVRFVSEADTRLRFDAWTDAAHQGGGSSGTLLSGSLSLNPGEDFSIDLSQQVPGNAPAGQYDYSLHAGDEFPRVVWSQDTFTFTKE